MADPTGDTMTNFGDIVDDIRPDLPEYGACDDCHHRSVTPLRAYGGRQLKLCFACHQRRAAVRDGTVRVSTKSRSWPEALAKPRSQYRRRRPLLQCEGCKRTLLPAEHPNVVAWSKRDLDDARAERNPPWCPDCLKANQTWAAGS